MTGQFEFVVDEHFRSVVEFMQTAIPASKLLGIAEQLPHVARLLWGDVAQEPVKVITLTGKPLGVSTQCETQPVAIV